MRRRCRTAEKCNAYARRDGDSLSMPAVREGGIRRVDEQSAVTILVIKTFSSDRKTRSVVMIKMKRVYESPSHQDGLRILVERLWPRGLPKDRAAVDR